mgnify:CR=1 FL=1
MRYKTKSRKAGYGEYLVTVTDTQNIKPTVTVKIEDYGPENAYWCRWRIGEPVRFFKGTEYEHIDYEFDGCCGFYSKKEAIKCLQQEGAHIGDETVTD